MKGKDTRSIWKGHKTYKHDRHGKHSMWQDIRQARCTNKQESRQTDKQTNKKRKKANKRWCPRGTNVSLDWMSITSLCWSLDDTLASKTYAWTCKQACKDAKKANGWHKQARQAYHCMEWKRERHAWSNRYHGNASQMVTSKQGLRGVRCNHATTNPLRASSMAKSRIREANISIKHKSKQA